MDLSYENKERESDIYQMYQEIFEDPEEFARYYFQEIYPGNKVLAAQEKDEIRGMIHLNPYKVRVGQKDWRLHYIVAVAVREQYRRQGIMAQMLKRCLNDMARNGEPFTYLMPADRAYYEPFGFAFIMDWIEAQTKGQKAEKQGVIVPAAEENYDEISLFLEEFLKKFCVYTVPDKAYLKRTQLESQSSEGNLMIWKKGGRMRGVFAQGIEDGKAFIRWAFSKEPKQMLEQIKEYFPDRMIEFTGGNIIQGERVPKIMARITCLKAWEEILKAGENISFRLNIEDSLIRENNGTFCFEGGKEGVKIRKEKEDGDAEKILVEDLTRVFFGYDTEQILNQYPCLKSILPAGPVYISEEV